MRKTPWNREDHILRLEELTGDRKEHWQGFSSTYDGICGYLECVAYRLASLDGY